MKTLFTFLISIGVGFANWQGITSDSATETKLKLVSSNVETTTLEFNIDGFNLVPVATEQGEMFMARLNDGASLLEAGAPNLQKFGRSIIIPDLAEMHINVLSFNYTEYENVLIAPSKGNLSRLVNPADIPFEFAAVYEDDTFYPGELVELDNPYILRDLRGQNVVFYPFQYNPVQKVLRVYTSIEVEIYAEGNSNVNTITNRSGEVKYPREFVNIYKNHFLNFNNDTRFNYLVDQGNMLIISYGSFMSEMADFVDWKNRKGVPTEMVNVTDIGSNSGAIKDYVSDYYETNGLTFLLLVGDAVQIPSTYLGGAASDPNYGFLLGNDFYAEVIVGRFSAESPSHVATQVERSIDYERNPQAGADWYSSSLGIASNQGPGYGGYTDDDFNEYVLKPILMDFTYDSYQGIYDPSGTLSQGLTAINNGVGIINYTGHGYQQGWGNGAPLDNNNVNSLTNNNKLPFVITVGCNVGEFDNYLSFGEVWQRATNNGEPTGGIGHYGSTISQSWEPPMHGQVGMNLILTESYDDHLTRTMGGIATNGCMFMNDAQGSSGINETKYWTLFGDPSLWLRTAAPTNLSVSHEDIIFLGAAESTVSTGREGDLVALSRDGELLASGYTGSAGFVALELGDSSSEPGELDLVVTGFNAIPFETTITVLSPEGAFVLVNEVTVNAGFDELIEFGETVDLTISLENIGSEAALGVDVTISIDDTYITITNGTTMVYSLPPNSSYELEGLQFEVSADVPNNHNFTLAILISTGDDSWESTLSFTAYAPLIEVVNTISDGFDPGNANASLIVNLNNNGGAVINYPEVAIETSDPFASVLHSGFTNAYYWDTGMVETLDAIVSISAACPIGHIVEFTIVIGQLNGNLNQEVTFSVSVGQVAANFENGFGSLDWVLSGNSDWGIDGAEANSGEASARSGEISINQESSLSVTLEVSAAGTINFYYMVSSEYSTSGNFFYDGLEFYIDDMLKGQFQPTTSGDSPWTAVSYDVSEGEHTFKWSYVKDNGGGSTDCDNTACQDAAWIDDIVFPPVYVDSEYIIGDVNGDLAVNILDVILTVNMVLGTEPESPLADLNNDGLINILDIISIVNIILEGRAEDAASAQIYDTGHALKLNADGYIGAVQLTLSHNKDLAINVTEKALFGNYHTTDNKTIVIIVAPESNELFSYSGNFDISAIEVANSIELIPVTLPVRTALNPAFPNPFNPSTVISYRLAIKSNTQLDIYNITGQLVESLVNGYQEAGSYEVKWNPAGIPSGMYFARLASGNITQTQKLLFIK